MAETKQDARNTIVIPKPISNVFIAAPPYALYHPRAPGLPNFGIR